MAPCNVELDISALKAERARSRQKHIQVKREEYQRARARSTAPPTPFKVKPHRIARAAARTCVSKGYVEVDSDMPALVSMGRSSSEGPRSRKPSVAPVVRLVQDICAFDDMDMDFRTAPRSWRRGSSAGPAKGSDTEAVATDVGGSSAPEDLSDESRSEDEADVRPIDLAEPEPAVQEAADVDGEAETKVEQKEPIDREKILREVVDKLRDQARQERGRVASVEAENAALRERLGTVKAKESSKVDKKAALQLEKQRAAELRKRRRQEQHVQKMMDKAEQKLKEAEQTREQVENDGLAAVAAHIANANVEAQEHARTLALAEVARARSFTAELAQRRLQSAAEKSAKMAEASRAEADAVRAQAQDAASAVKKQAEEMEAEVAKQAKLVKRRAEIEARVLRGRAECEVAAIKAATEAEQKAAADADLARRARQEAIEKKEAAAALRKEKELSCQRAKQLRRRAETDRLEDLKRQKEIQENQARAAEESAALRKKAIEEAAVLREKGRAEADRMKARAVAAARAETEANAAAVQAAAEERARTIREAAETEARKLREAAKAELEAAKAVAAAASSPSLSAAADPTDGAWEVLLEDGSEMSASIAKDAEIRAEDDGWSFVA